MSKLQNKVSALADFSWYALTDLLGSGSKKRPPVYLFLSPESKGSLKKRSPEEVELVHDQQVKKGGVTLIDPPCAWVSTLKQVPEETAHLFALVHQTKKPPRLADPGQELRMMIQHEAFGRFASEMIFGFLPKPRRPKRPTRKTTTRMDLWNLGHREGYFLGHHLADTFYREQTPRMEIKKWFQMDWSVQNEASLRRLYQLTRTKPLF